MPRLVGYERYEGIDALHKLTELYSIIRLYVKFFSTINETIPQRNKLLHDHLSDVCPDVHGNRLQAIMKVAYGLQKSQNLSLTAMGRKLNDDIDIKHKIKTVDRLENNKHLHDELSYIYSGLSNYLFKYLSKYKNMPVIIGLCFLQDNNNIQMLSAEIASKGRSLPLYREIFNAGELTGRAKQFLSKLSECIPSDKKILVITDAVSVKIGLKK